MALGLTTALNLAALQDGERRTSSPEMLGHFNVAKDLFLPQFDVKTDVDDLHSVAAVATILRDPRFKAVRYHAVAGAYGMQSGEYVPAPGVFDMAFGDQWSDAHGDRELALERVSSLVVNTLKNGGDIWIAEAGQSDFSASMVRNIKALLPATDSKQRIHLVQHSPWNQESTTPADLEYVKEQTDYHKIEDGNFEGNGTPGFNTASDEDWSRVLADPKVGRLWLETRNIANQFNGTPTRYHNEAISAGGMDFSDTVETCWIFGFSELADVSEFFDEFLTGN